MSRKTTAREIAFEILRRVETEGAFASILLQRLPDEIPLAEVQLATELVYGALRNRLHDEYLLEALSGRPMKKIDPEAAILFRVAAHQILRLDRIPDHAAVSEAVEAARGGVGDGRGRRVAGPGRARAVAGFLNAILRRLCRERGRLPLPEIPPASAGAEPLAGALSIRHSYPAWIVRRWIDRFGPSEAVRLMEAGNRPAASTVRVDPARASVQEVRDSLAADGIETEIRSFPPGFLRVTRGVPRRSKAFAEGLIYIQDEASGIVPLILAPEPGSTVLDACAAPGGKSLALARMVGPEGLVVASDLHLSRVRLVASNAARLGVANIRLLACDITAAPLSRPFDAVLVDAPCSGSGVFRRDPESRYRLTRQDLGALVRRQEEILEGAAVLVKPGGRLVYAVCSLEPEEGEERISRFLAEHEEFRMDGLEDRLGGRADLIGEDGAMRTLPHRHDMDGFYAAALVRASSTGAC